MPHRRSRSRFGATLIELSFSVVILAVVFGLLAMTWSVEKRSLGVSTRATTSETSTRELLARIEDEIRFARGASPVAWLAEDLAAGGSFAEVDTTSGFPDTGSLLIDRGNALEERLTYGILAAGFDELVRGQACTEDVTHGSGAQVRWAPLATALSGQVAPPASQWDGMALDLGRQVFFAGDGTGFSYQVPTDPTGGTNYFDGAAITWGATWGDAPSLDGWHALEFVPAFEVVEAELLADINGDGDRADRFDVGQIVRRTWLASNPGAGSFDVALGPRAILQESCNWGGDLDADGFDDPIFVWDPVRRRVQIRLHYLVGTDVDQAFARRVQTSIFLRNATGP